MSKTSEIQINERKRAFAIYYVETLNAYQSAIRAGYSENYARAQSYKLLEDVGVKKYIEELMGSKDDYRIASQDEILQILTDIARGITEEEVVSFNPMGDELRATKRPSIKDRMKATELLGKRYKLFTDKVDVEASVGVTIIDDIGTLEDA